VLRSVVLGFVKLHVLHHAGLEPVHGAALMRELARHGHEIGPGTLYPLLHTLEREGLLESQERVVDRRRRREYRLTPEGARILEAARALLAEVADELLHGAGPATILGRQDGSERD